MGIYNCAPTLPEAIDSLLAQTYTDWNLILCDDGSIDDTYDTARNYQEKYPDRITLLKNETNKGLNYTLNHCLEYADGDFVARMDGDDISLPERFEKEVRVLEEHPEYAIVSAPMIYFDADGEWGRGKPNPYPVKKDFLRGTPFCHAPCMVRREAYEAVGGYTDDPKYLRVEDYDLWIKMYAAGYAGMNLTEPLYCMRDDRNAASRRKFRYRINEFYARCKAIRVLRLPVYGYIFSLRPLIVGILPAFLYEFLHKKRLKVSRND